MYTVVVRESMRVKSIKLRRDMKALGGSVEDYRKSSL